MPRLFTALEIPADVGQSLSMLRGGLPGARWIDPENYHLTLRFIGDIDDALAQTKLPSCSAASARRFRAAARRAFLVSAAASRARWSPPSADPAAARTAGRARTADAARRAGAGRPQIHAARHAGAAARFLEPAGRGLSGGARAFRSQPFACRPRLCCSRRALGRRRALRGRGRAIRCFRRRANPRSGLQSACRRVWASSAVAKPWPSATNSRITDSGVGARRATSPTTLPKSNDSSASNLRASCCMR